MPQTTKTRVVRAFEWALEEGEAIFVQSKQASVRWLRVD